MEIIVQKELFRRATIEWVCFSWKQLVYMTPYFLVPGITCMVEWGWNHYNIKSLVNLGDRDEMRRLWDNAYPLYFKNILLSNGNYDVIYGIVTNFNWSIEGNHIICSTEITSKDRLYTGIAKDYALTVTKKETDVGGSLFQSIITFLTKDDTAKSLRTIVTKPSGIGKTAILANSGSINSNNSNDNSQKLLNIFAAADARLGTGGSTNGVVTNNNIAIDTKESSGKTWLNILNPLLNDGSDEVKNMRRPYVFGLFSGRGTMKDEPDINNSLGNAKNKDWDYKINSNSPINIWINMGMVVQILNYFSALDSGAGNGQNEFYVDIQNSVIGAHPNMISCDPRVLIPNASAPKYHWGNIGYKATVGTDRSQFINRTVDWWTFNMNPISPYQKQIHNPITFNPTDKSQISNIVLGKVFYQGLTTCFRNDISKPINYNRRRFFGTDAPGGLDFPSTVTKELPETYRGLKKNEVEKERSGLLSNIYIRFDVLKSAVDDQTSKTPSYADIYPYIFKILQDSVDGFWDLALVSVDGTMTVADRKYVGKYALDHGIDSNGNQIESTETVYSFDYYDADSIIKSIKFKPQLSDAQATRTIYGEVNNKDSKYKYLDKNDVLDYKFRDCVIGTSQIKKYGDAKAELAKRKSANSEHQDMVRKVQLINNKTDDPGLQMSLITEGGSDDNPNIVKLVLPDQQLLRMMLNDGDEEGNARYCAVQPGIILELTLQGIGGLRTFQYFTVKNLPEPYSDRNIIFRITDVQQTLEAGNWETTIRAQPLPLRAYIKQRLRGPLKDPTPHDGNGWPIDSTSKRTPPPTK